MVLMAKQGFDCAATLTAPVANMFKRDGKDFVCRYLVPSGWKRLTKVEADIITAAGLQIVSVFETTEDRALGGREAGLEDGAAAERVAAEVSQPAGSCIYFAVDFDVKPDQMETVIEYIRGASEATPNYSTGVYGCCALIEAAVAASACSHFWQTLAWSHGLKSEYANIYQCDNGPEGQGMCINGIDVDLDESHGNEGWWNTAPAPVEAPAEEPVVEEPPTPPPFPFDQVSALKVVVILQALYDACADSQVQAAAHHAAKALRDAVGLPEE